MSPPEGRAVLITGAGGDIGRSIAVALAEVGVSLVLTDRDSAAVQKTAAAAGKAGIRTHTITANLLRPGTAHALVSEATEWLGGLDIVVNAAGVCRGVEAERLTPALWEEALTVCFQAPAHICAAAAPHLERRRGNVLNIASVVGFTAFPTAIPYAAAKAELIAHTRMLAAAWRPRGIRVNVLCPGWTRTGMTEHLWRSPRACDALLQQVPLGRWATPDEIAQAAVFLTARSPLTGAVLIVDGGLLAL